MSTVSALGYALGEPVPIGTLAARGHSSSVVEELERRGQRTTHIASSTTELLAASIGATMAATSLDPAEITRVIVCSESAVVAADKQQHEEQRAALYGVLVAHGLERAGVTLLTYAGCSSIVTALELADLLVTSGSAPAVMIVGVDRALTESARVLPPTVSVVGDGAASCIVTAGTAPTAACRLVAFGRQSFLEVVDTTPGADDFGPALISLARALNGVMGQLRSSHEIDNEATLVCNNYGLPTVDMLCRSTGLSRGEAFTDNLARVGHIGTPDLLINLADMAPVPSAVLVGNGQADCAVALVHASEPGE